jgi:hypothetical protein
MSAEDSMNGTPNEVGYFNGFEYTVEQMLPLIPVWARPDLQSLRGALGLRDGHPLSLGLSRSHRTSAVGAPAW